LRAWSMARARIAVARKRAAILHRMWADGAELRCGEDDAAIAARRRSSFRPKAQAEAGRSRGNDGSGDPAKSPEPRGSRLEGRPTDWDAYLPDPMLRRPTRRPRIEARDPRMRQEQGAARSLRPNQRMLSHLAPPSVRLGLGSMSRRSGPGRVRFSNSKPHSWPLVDRAVGRVPPCDVPPQVLCCTAQ
jgi:hypothetical protein